MTQTGIQRIGYSNVGIRQWKSEKTGFDRQRDRANGITTREEDERGIENPRYLAAQHDRRVLFYFFMEPAPRALAFGSMF